MDNMILEFLEAYKSLDELCKQILSSDRGISEYIDEMNRESQGRMRVACWEMDYKRLKKLRWIRNQLVHETNSFQDDLISLEDIEWLKNFYARIMECTDPFSLLHQSRNIRKTTVNKEKYLENHFETKKPFIDRDLVISAIILIGIIFVIIIWQVSSNF